ncbi:MULTISPECIES: NAD(P)-dependent oxidoreductase [Streptomyces]|uniref:NAD(P)-dependent oxidoreductase n=1 Tax=Streptomyces caniscabiei TaxID=2746961 RepID=A0ABU4MZD2_9ACTN|nr:MULTISPECIES: NAD(P)-dependent oxidoreductase [Streptomyces]MBE4741277.1 NAD(P)-dependent oxidoreductase [Streptomyces caniscabiei]MBE4760928.1 NAD(P)-dependent oxidoreductase [Streptomyces caniscabiei]MBE4774915.1 NAD(P)-dependent oxidoreductase [Streptomyces caniscabiei]MBE4789673.1 NAD(P)-dependent oxidoreductase [Streptomyces caniscabiei]MBE4798856.1 NAD(P)-dependent oxidoreductase [Streptomyces caniscabiei]
MTSTTAPVGFIGLGNMGGRMARRLVAAGYDVLGHDMRTENVTACGATPVESVAEVARRCDVVLLSLPESKVVEAVVLGEQGVLAGAREGQVVVDLSTSAPTSTTHLHEQLAQRGATLLDAGISGGAAAAEKGALTLMVGGDATTLDRVRPLLAAFSVNVFHCGPVGAGHTAKLLNNFLNAIALSATAEVMVAGRKAGLDLQVLLDVLNTSSGVNFATQNRFPKIIQGDYLKGGLTNALMMKDVLAYVDLVTGLGVASPNSAAPLASFGLALQLGYEQDISNTVVDAIGDLSGRVRVHDGAYDAGKDKS